MTQTKRRDGPNLVSPIVSPEWFRFQPWLKDAFSHRKKRGFHPRNVRKHERDKHNDHNKRNKHS